VSAVTSEQLAKTLPGRLALHARTHPDDVAMREKRLGIWQEYTWRDYWQRVGWSARMLWELGIRPGDHVALLSDNRPEWLWVDLGAQTIGARSVGIYQTNPPPDVAYVLQDSGTKVLFCEDQEQVDKAIEVAEETPAVTRVVVFDPRGTRNIEDPRLMRWQEFADGGRELLGESPDWLEERLAQLDPDKPAMVVYTSGTTGPPKGAMISSRNALAVGRALEQRIGREIDYSVLSYLPLCHVAEKIISLFVPMIRGGVVHFGESIDTVQTDLREVSPTVFLGVPRIWEKMSAAVNVKMQNASLAKRSLFRFFSRKGREIGRHRREGRLGLWDRAVWRVGDLLVYRPLQERLGLRRCRRPVTGAAPISADLLDWYHGIGVRIVEAYGQTECAGVSHFNPPESPQLGSVGPVIEEVEQRVSEDGEILVRGPNVFCGYLNRPDATAATVDEEGWLHTGDVGEVDERGYLRITGRKKEIIITSGGKNLSPEKIENALKTSAYIKEAIAIGDGRKFIAALVQIDLDSVGDWATRQSIPYTSFADLSDKDPVRKLIKEEVERANALLARVEQVRAFRLLRKELHQDDGELTATQKVKRKVVHGAFAELIEEMYASGGGPG